MSVYRFKVFFEEDESVIREIEIKSTQNFEDFHKIIQRAINFDDLHPASFFISNDTWRKGKEIKLLRNKKGALQKAIWMHETKLAAHVEDPHQKMIYEFDPDNALWVLFIELSKILPDSPIEYPRISKSTGIAPAQYKITTPVDVVEEDEEEGHAHVEVDDAYVHSTSDVTEHFEAHEEDEVDGQIVAKAKSSDSHEEDGEVSEPEGEAEGFEEEGGFEEEDI
jgi:pRiA4b ORF-3-like protein